MIGPDVKITVIRIGPNSVRIGIDAPGDLAIVREELIWNLTPEAAAAESEHAESVAQ